jgi:Pentapeptide repeats (8 copies)
MNLLQAGAKASARACSSVSASPAAKAAAQTSSPSAARAAATASSTSACSGSGAPIVSRSAAAAPRLSCSRSSWLSHVLAPGPSSYSCGSDYTGSSASLTLYVDTDIIRYLRNGIYNLSNVNLPGGYFVGENLSGANLADGEFSGANFSFANLRGASLSDGNFSSANFTRTNLSGANLAEANLKGATLINVIWSTPSVQTAPTATTTAAPACAISSLKQLAMPVNSRCIYTV